MYMESLIVNSKILRLCMAHTSVNTYIIFALKVINVY
jgi:hypothetical protein